MAETKEALLPHTYALDVKSLYLNGVLMGEISLEAAIAGIFGVPLIMVSGDFKGIEEAEKLLKNVEKAVVKYAISKEGGGLPTSFNDEGDYKEEGKNCFGKNR